MRIRTALFLLFFAPVLSFGQFDYDAKILDYKGLKFPCSGTVTPKLLIRNDGNESMSGCVVETWKNGVLVNTFDWQLAIPAVEGESRQPVFPPVSGVEPGDELEFKIKTVNTIPDENPDGNERVVPMTDEYASTPDDAIEVRIFTDDSPGDLTWEIRNTLGGLIASGGPYTEANTMISAFVPLGNTSCYSFKGADGGRDGASGAAIRIISNGNTMLAFGQAELTVSLTKGVTTGAGVGCTQQLAIELTTDAQPAETDWRIIALADGSTVCTGSGALPISGTAVEACCLPDGCYRLVVTDGGGDGITGGGYLLRAAGGERVIDNAGNFLSGASSSISGAQGFCLPMGATKPIFSSCDKLDWVNNRFIVAAVDQQVSAQFGVTNTTSGYEFWFFDPNGTYSFRRFRSHATSDGFGTGATRACHFKLNGWINTPIAPHLPAQTLLNVRVRGRVAGVNKEFGGACRFKIDALLAACPRVKLQNDPANTADFSCGVTRQFGGSNGSANRLVAAPPQFVPAVNSSNVRYQFRFRSAGQCVVRPAQTSPTIHLNWNDGPALVCGETYGVDVRVSRNGGSTWCFGPATADQAAACADTEAWGTLCSVTIGPCAVLNGGSNTAVLQGEGTFTMYPNPCRGEQLFLSLSGVEVGVNTVSVDIYDMAGKRLMVRTIAVQDGLVNASMELNGELAQGIYLVRIQAGTKAYTDRLVIE